MSGETQLLEMARAGSLPAFEELVSLYEKKVYNYCFRMTNNKEDAEDLTQEVFIKVFKSLQSFKGNSQLSTWIYRIAHNICIDKFRKSKVTLVSLSPSKEKEDDREMDLPSPEPSPEDKLLTKEHRELVQSCINGLKPEYRSVIVLRDIQHYSYEEIADILNVPLGTVKSHISRARLALREAAGSLI